MDHRTMGEKKALFESGLEEEKKKWMQEAWDTNNKDYTNRSKNRLVKWFGERPGKKAGDPDTPEEEAKPAEDDTDLMEELIPPTCEDEEEEEPEVEEEEEEEEESEEEGRGGRRG